MKLQRYTVKGLGAFPIDMLRYDQSFPLVEDGSAKIISCERDIEIILGRHVEDEKDLPCDGRWRSFGWKVVEGSVEII